MVKCCDNCKYYVAIPRNNKYNDIDYLCIINSYFIINIYKDLSKVRHLTPGGKELKCKFENKFTK